MRIFWEHFCGVLAILVILIVTALVGAALGIGLVEIVRMIV